jgi:hypothetical protein
MWYMYRRQLRKAMPEFASKSSQWPSHQSLLRVPRELDTGRAHYLALAVARWLELVHRPCGVGGKDAIPENGNVCGNASEGRGVVQEKKGEVVKPTLHTREQDKSIGAVLVA